MIILAEPMMAELVCYQCECKCKLIYSALSFRNLLMRSMLY